MTGLDSSSLAGARSFTAAPEERANHDEMYRHARVYDVAFAYRDFEAEVDFLIACHERFAGKKPARFLEVAAGPGVHALVAAKRGIDAIALDLAPSMMELCAKKARELGVRVKTIVADMRMFELGDEVEGLSDLAFNPITSISYLRTPDALVDHMRSMARALVKGGVYVVENNHPKDFIRHEHFVPSTWTMNDDGLTVTTTWVAEAPPKIDSSKQLYEAVCRYEVDRGGEKSFIEDRAWLRMTLPAELELAGKLAGLELVAHLGDLSLDKPFDDTGWRSVLVFRKA